MTFDFTVDAFPGYVKGSANKTLAAIQVLGADDNYDAATGDDDTGEVTYKRYLYNKDNAPYFNSEKITEDDTEDSGE